ncbi:MAG: hypothetical protein QOI46_2440, partial [Alphaproteobacteria bacterium]|nr:hypothetical protein [Alphaproteobacteria bacterium]
GPLSAGAAKLGGKYIAHSIQVEVMRRDQIGRIGDYCVDVAHQPQTLIEIGDMDAQKACGEDRRVYEAGRLSRLTA